MNGWQQPIIPWNKNLPKINDKDMFIEAITPNTSDPKILKTVMTPLFKNKKGT